MCIIIPVYNDVCVHMCMFMVRIFMRVFMSVDTCVAAQVNVCVFVSAGKCMGKIGYPG